MALNTYGTLKSEIDAEGKWSSAHDAQVPEWIERAEDWMFTYPEFRIRAMEAEQDMKVSAAITDATVGGTANAITLTNSTTKTSNSYGDTYSFEVAADNTSATVTVNVDGIGAVNLKRGYDGEAGLSTAPPSLFDGATVRIMYDGTNFRMNPKGGIVLPSDYVAMRRIYMPGDPIERLEHLDSINFWDRYIASETGKPKAFTVEADHIVFGPTADGTYFPKMLYYRRLAALSADSDTNWILTNARGLYFFASMAQGYAYLGDPAKALTYQTQADNLMKQVIDSDKDDRYSGDSIVMKSDVSTLGI